MANRIEVLKTYKIYIGGQFPRTESGRYYKPYNSNNELLGNICLSSRKDFRNAVVAARKAQGSWAGKSAYNRSQILYRIAENLESRKSEFVDLIKKEGTITNAKATQVVEESIDRLIYFAGWADKYQQIFSAVNPVASSHFNFTIQEPVGVVAAICGDKIDLKCFISAISAIIVSGNSLVILANEDAPISAISFAEVLQHSDVPAGVVNILTGKVEELKNHMASHMDVNALLLLNIPVEQKTEIEKLATENLKRVRSWTTDQIKSNALESPFKIMEFLENKTTWHPIEQIGGATAGY